MMHYYTMELCGVVYVKVIVNVQTKMMQPKRIMILMTILVNIPDYTNEYSQLCCMFNVWYQSTPRMRVSSAACSMCGISPRRV